MTVVRFFYSPFQLELLQKHVYFVFCCDDDGAYLFISLLEKRLCTVNILILWNCVFVYVCVCACVCACVCVLER